MKYVPAQLVYFLRNRASQRNIGLMLRFLAAVTAVTILYSILFHILMAREGQEMSWLTGVYWTLTVMSTLGFGDITFHSDLGRAFSIVVLLSGVVFLMILLPFTFINFFYAPWMEAQAEARAPRSLPAKTQGHVLLTYHDAVTTALIGRLTRYGYDYALLVPELNEALRLHDLGYRVVLGDLDNPETYERARVHQAAMVVTTASDEVNTNVAITVREIDAAVPIIATANHHDSVDILELAGCTHVFELAELLGHWLARRAHNGRTVTHVIGRLNELLIAEATVAGTTLVGRTLAECGLREEVGLTVVGLWEHGQFQTPRADTTISPSSVLVLAGSRAQLDCLDKKSGVQGGSQIPVVIIGGGRVGQAAGRSLAQRGIDYRIVERNPEQIEDAERYILGNAANLHVLARAELNRAPAVIITTHDDDTNIYVAIYCRRLRPDIKIISRATLERNVQTLHRAGSDFIMSYASLGANSIFNLLRRRDTVMVAEGLNVFKVQLPVSLAGRSLRESAIRKHSGCSVIAVEHDGQIQINPDPGAPLPADARLILIGSVEEENAFLREYASARESVSA
ncbi:MAG: potassium channel protein [Phycisphaerae bacterium]|nr:potassium channel protein [Phycisphaerae bacterium]